MPSTLHPHGPLRHHFTAMGSRCELCIDGIAPAQAPALWAVCVAEVARIEARYSRYRPDSFLSQINRTAGTGQAVPLDDETAALLAWGGQLHAISAGRFDLTSGVLRTAWSFTPPRLPDPAQLQAVLQDVGWQHLRLHMRQPATLELTRPGMQLDLGGIGKEYAADRAAQRLMEQGVAHGYVNLGGDIRVIGPQADGRPWTFGVQDPRRPEAHAATLQLSQGALATSGDYERYFELDGRRYCHILDARTGWPVSRWQSATVIAPVCAAAGALATLAMLWGDEAPQQLDAQQVPYLLVESKNGLTAITQAGLAGSLP